VAQISRIAGGTESVADSIVCRRVYEQRNRWVTLDSLFPGCNQDHARGFSGVCRRIAAQEMKEMGFSVIIMSPEMSTIGSSLESDQISTEKFAGG
jgi:hypothetical protein